MAKDNRFLYSSIVANSLENMLLLIKLGLEKGFYRNDKELANLLDNAALDIYVLADKELPDWNRDKVKETATGLADSFKWVFRCGALSPYDVRRAKAWYKSTVELIDELRGALVLNYKGLCESSNTALDAYAATKP